MITPFTTCGETSIIFRSILRNYVALNAVIDIKRSVIIFTLFSQVMLRQIVKSVGSKMRHLTSHYSIKEIHTISFL